jgi:hypothetical protein
LPHPEVREWRRHPEPPGERILACARPRRGEQLEERSGSEQIEIARVEVRVVKEARSRLAAAGPALFDPCDSARVELNAARAQITRPDDPVVPHRQREKSGNWRRDPPR